MNTIKIVVENDYSYLDGSVSKEVFDEIRQSISYYSPGYQFSPRYNTFKNGKRVWDGKISLYKKMKGKWRFPTGMASYAVKVLENNGLEWKLDDRRNHVEKNLNLSLAEYFVKDGKKIKVTARDYQEIATDKSISKKRGIVKIATGGGKSFVSANIIANVSRGPVIFYVLSKDLMYQTMAEFSKFIWQNGKPLEVGQIGDGICDIKDVNVCTIQTCAQALGKKNKKKSDDEPNSKEKKVKKESHIQILNLIQKAKVIFVDEVHHAAADTVQQVVEASKEAVYRFGMSASPWRDDGLDMLIESCFGRYLVDINASYLIKRGFLIQPSIYMVTVDTKPSEDATNYHAIYDECIVNNEYRNNMIAEFANKLSNDGHSTLILVKNIEHGNMLESMIDGSLFISGKDTTKIRKETIQELKEGKRKIVIASTIADEGLDIPNLSALILGGSGKSSTRALQRIGRALRPDNVSGKDSAIIIDFYDQAKYLKTHARQREKIYKTEKEFKVIKK